MLGRRLDVADGFRDKGVLRAAAWSERSLCGIVSAKLGSVSSRMSDNGRTFAQEETLAEEALDSPNELPTMPPQLVT